MVTRTLSAVVVVGLVLGSAGSSQGTGERQARVDTAPDVARALLDQQAVVELPVEGKVKRSIDKDDPTFVMHAGHTSALLFELPTYQTPYVMAIKSSRRGIGRTTEIFVPGGMFLDADLGELDGFGEEALVGRVESFVAELIVDEARADAGYLLLFTRGETVGQQVVFGGQNARDDVVYQLLQTGFAKVERSLEARLEIETRPRPHYRQAQNKTPAEIVRLMVDHDKAVQVPAKGNVKHEVEPEPPTFVIEGRPTSVAVLELPAYQSPYALKIKSSSTHGGIFVPSGTYFDADLRQVAALTENQLRGKRTLDVQVVFDDSARDVRYLLLYTRGDLVGLTVQRPVGLSPSEPTRWVVRGLAAKLDIETKPVSEVDAAEFPPFATAATANPSTDTTAIKTTVPPLLPESQVQ